MHRVIAVVFFCVGCTARTEPRALTDPLTVEVLAARHLLARHANRPVHLDSAFALHGHAPGAPSARVRPADRNGLLADSLKAGPARELSDAVARVTLSEPEFAEHSAVVTVTISYEQGPRGKFYETVLVFLRRASRAWHVERSVQLGIT